jgi:hypothetical protein
MISDVNKPVPAGAEWIKAYRRWRRQPSGTEEGRPTRNKTVAAQGSNLSEYRYYEFQALDRLLTQHEMCELRKYS